MPKKAAARVGNSRGRDDTESPLNIGNTAMKAISTSSHSRYLSRRVRRVIAGSVVRRTSEMVVAQDALRRARTLAPSARRVAHHFPPQARVWGPWDAIWAMFYPKPGGQSGPSTRGLRHCISHDRDCSPTDLSQLPSLLETATLNRTSVLQVRYMGSAGLRLRWTAIAPSNLKSVAVHRFSTAPPGGGTCLT